VQSILERLNLFFEAAPQKLLHWRWTVIALFVVVTSVMVYGMLSRFTLDMSLESWFQDDDPAKVSLDDFRQQFGSDDGLYIVYRPKDGDVFSQRSLDTLRDFHNELDAIRYDPANAQTADNENPNLLSRIIRIDSLLNGRYQIADGDTLISQKLLANYPRSDEEREAKRNIALGQEAFELAYYSKDFNYGGMRIKTDFGVVPVEQHTAEMAGDTDLLSDDDFEVGTSLVIDESISNTPIEYQDMQMDEYLAFMGDLRAVATQEKYQHFEFFYTGNAAMMEFAMNNLKQASSLLGLMLIVVVVLLWILFHSWSAVIWPVLVIACSAFWSIGLLSWFGIALSNMVSLSFMLILAVGVADCVHVLSAYTLYRREGSDHRPAMKLAYRKTGLPIFLTTVTTMAGMSALMVSDLPQIGVFGVNSAMGVGVAFIFTIFLLPVLLDIWHPYHAKAERKFAMRDKHHWLQPLLDKIPHYVARKAKPIVLIYFGIFALFVWGGTQVRIDTNLAELTKEGSDIRVTYDIVDANMMGGQNMEFMLNFGQTDALKDPKVLSAIAGLQTHMESTYPDIVVKTFSLADLVEDTNWVMHEGRDAFKIIPEDARLTAQLLYLFDNANADDRRQLVNDNYSQSHISLQIKNKGSYEYANFFEAAQEDLERYFSPLKSSYPDLDTHVTGSLALMMKLVDYISWAQLKSFAFALIIITILLVISLGSVQAGLISMVPNLLPAFFTFGVMGLLGIPLDTDTLIIAPLIIGIAVDDTIHFIAHYRDAWFELGDVEAALASTVKEVGQAVTFTTLVLGLGFSMLAFSDYMGLAKTGIFGSLAIFVALSSDLLLFPALISWLRPDLGRRRYLANKSKAENTLCSS
jgi:uncharacterized protein